jgi:hypothetical protein
LFLALAAAAGCDLTGQYEAKFKKALETSAQRAVFDLNLHPTFTEVTDPARKEVGVKLRLPKFFDSNSKSISAANVKGPTVAQLPGLSYYIERPLDDPSGKFLPANVYFAAIPKAEQKADALQAAVAQMAATVVPGVAWSDVELATPNGQKLALKRLQAHGAQPFADAQKKAPVKVEGRFDLYYIDGGDYHVLVGWRAPKAQAEKYQFDVATQASMGTVEVANPSGSGGKAGGAAPPAGG